MKMECDYLNGLNKNGHIRKNLTKIMNPRDTAGEHRRRRTKSVSCLVVMSVASIVVIIHDLQVLTVTVE